MPFKRCAVSFFYDEHGILDDYYVFLLRSMRPFVDTLILVVNGNMDDASRKKIVPIVDKMIVRDNVGFDVWAYKTGLEYVWANHAHEFDEILMHNHTFYGPLYPFSEMFGTVEKVDCDFWGITAHKEEKDVSPAGVERIIPYHLNSHFIAVRRVLLEDPSFRAYWQDMRMIKSYQDSIDHHELRFTKHFQDLNFRQFSYVDPAKFGSAYSAFMELDATIASGSPILKRRAFFHDPGFMDERAVDLPRAMRIVKERTKYDTSLIWRNILRSTPAKYLQANLALMRVFPDVPIHRPEIEAKSPRIAVCAHAYYAELIDELLDFTQNIRVEYDLIVTTNTPDKKKHIEEAAAKRPGIGNIIVRLWPERGRDISSLLVTCNDLFLDDRYDFVCRVHTKKSPQVGASLGNYFKRYMLDNVLNSEGYVTNILDLFDAEPQLGIVAPPMIHVSTPTLGHAWFINRDNALALGKRLGLRVPFDAISPLAVYGGMFWFRPKALRKLFEAKFTYDEFEPEPLPVDGALAHAIERTIVYVAQDAGYYTMTAAASHQAEAAYTRLEYKTNVLASFLPTGTFRDQVALLREFQPVMRASWTGNIDTMRLDAGDIQASSAAIINSERKQAILEREIDHLKSRLRSRSNAWGMTKKNKIASVLSVAFTPKQIIQEASIIKRYLQHLRTAIGDRIIIPNYSQIVRYLQIGYLEGQEIFPLFDSLHYLRQQPDVMNSDMNPFIHFILHGWRESRPPHPLIDIDFMRILNPERHRRDGVPFADYMQYATAEMISPHYLFDTKFYLEQVDPGELIDTDPVQHYLTRGAVQGLNPTKLFNTKFYYAQFPELIEKNVNPLVHYIVHGPDDWRPTSPEFDSAAYLKAYPDVRFAEINPLLHYLKHGEPEGRKRFSMKVRSSTGISG